MQNLKLMRPEVWKHCQWCVHACVGQTFPYRLRFRRCRPDTTQLRTDAKAWQRSELTDVVIYEAFVDGRLEAPNILHARFTTFHRKSKIPI